VQRQTPNLILDNVIWKMMEAQSSFAAAHAPQYFETDDIRQYCQRTGKELCIKQVRVKNLHPYSVVYTVIDFQPARAQHCFPVHLLVSNPAGSDATNFRHSEAAPTTTTAFAATTRASSGRAATKTCP
jgi:hypothetical protein